MLSELAQSDQSLVHDWQLTTALCGCAAAAHVAIEPAVLAQLLVHFSGIVGRLFAGVTWLLQRDTAKQCYAACRW